MLGLNPKIPRFVRVFSDVATVSLDGLNAFDRAVKAGTFPTAAESYL
jgi:ketopantoate hydroxymethyltransferase